MQCLAQAYGGTCGRNQRFSDYRIDLGLVHACHEITQRIPYLLDS